MNSQQNSLSFNETNPLINAKNIAKIINFHDNKLTILQDLSLSVNKGEAVAIKGVSGSGKTTLLSLLAGLDQPTAGSISIGSIEITNLSEDEKADLRRNHLGFIFQNFQLLPNLTALENVMLALELQQNTKRKDLAKVKYLATEALTSVNLRDRLNHYPSQLSGGEQQRVAIARAFIVKPKLLFADEPTANIDQNTSNQIIDLLFSMQQEQHTTMIIVTHDPILAKRCSKQYSLEQGKLE